MTSCLYVRYYCKHHQSNELTPEEVGHMSTELFVKSALLTRAALCDSETACGSKREIPGLMASQLYQK